MADRIQVGATEPVTARFVDVNLDGLTGLSPTVKVWRKDTGLFWNGAGYAAGPTNHAMAAVDAANLPGTYQYDFIATDGQVAEVEHGFLASANDAAAINPDLQGAVTVGQWVDVIDADLDSLRDHAEGRHRIDTAPDPHQEVVHRRTGSRSGGAGTELKRFDLKDHAGSDINDGNAMPTVPPTVYDRNEP